MCELASVSDIRKGQLDKTFAMYFQTTIDYAFDETFATKVFKSIRKNRFNRSIIDR